MAFWRRNDSRADRADQAAGAGRRLPSREKMIRAQHRAEVDALLADGERRKAAIRAEAERALSRLEANGWQPPATTRLADDRRKQRAAWHICDGTFRFNDGTYTNTSYFLLSTGDVRRSDGRGVTQQEEKTVIEGLRQLGA